MGVTLSASGDGAIPSLSSRARTKWSIPLRAHAGFFVAGNGGRLTDRNDQCVLATPVPADATSLSGPLAPWSIQRFRTAICPADNGSPLGGILATSGFDPVTAWMSRLSDALC